MTNLIDKKLVQLDIAAGNKTQTHTRMYRKDLNTSRHGPFVRGPHFRFFILSLIAAFILAIVAIVGILVIFSFMFP